MKTIDILEGLDYVQRFVPGLDKTKPEELHAIPHQKITEMLKALDKKPGPLAVSKRK